MNELLRKPLRYGFSILIAAALVFFGFQLYRHQQAYGVASPVSRSSSFAPSGSSIKGFRFSANRDGRPSLAIRADRFELKKKKVGMLRFGLLNEALFRNARIDLYGYQTASVDSRSGQTQSAQQKDSPFPLNGAFSFTETLDAESLTAIPMKKVSALRFTPIALRLHVDGRLKVAVTADRASVKPQTRELAFKGNVRWTCGPVTLSADHLLASLEENVLRVPRSYHMDNHGTVTSGRGLRCDLMLNDIADATALAAKPETSPPTPQSNTSAKEVHSHAERR
ncbi:hypothetical protein DSCA_52940 [Desulfosarcina alkanivorans]|uniref:LPS export ABC transporter periplasmic protein LptC n=1 Tax=Desulfosarcina alkanivorans TaxID=571177 RepID=A0A5K7YYG6_9BACT|nr:hypothetical protein [Desulfosarcina alkanivorans]BBO71364.1 hypothetical protein DSCA_52940 [Desulfosarcina alkanivorans]